MRPEDSRPPVSLKASFPTVAPKCLAQISASCAGVLWTETEIQRGRCACCSVASMYITGRPEGSAE